MRSLFAEAFEKGCGLSLERILNSPQFQDAVQYEKTLYDRFPALSKEGDALRAKYWRTNLWITDERADVRRNPHPHAPIDEEFYQERVLLRLLGKKLIEAADKSLPLEGVTCAERWNKASAREIDGRIKDFCDIMHLINWYPRTPFEALLHSKVRHESDSVILRERFVGEAFPNQWAQHHIHPNCLGVAQILLAFAERTGSPFHLVTIVKYRHEAIQKIAGSVYELILKDIKQRKLSVPEEVIEQIRERTLDKDSWNGQLQFHHALVIRDPFYRWHLLDPYCDQYKVFDTDYWDIEKVHQALETYRVVLPGLTMGADDYGRLDRLEKGFLRTTENWLKKSRVVARKFKKIRNAPSRFLFNQLEHVPEWHSFLEETADKKLRYFQKHFLFPGGITTFQMLLSSSTGKKIGWSKDHFENIRRLTTDEEFLKASIDYLLTRFHAHIATQTDQILEGFEDSLFHPCLEVAADSHHLLALYVLNDLNHIRTTQEMSSRMLLHTASPLLWSSTVPDSNLQSLSSAEWINLYNGIVVGNYPFFPYDNYVAASKRQALVRLIEKEGRECHE